MRAVGYLWVSALCVLSACGHNKPSGDGAAAAATTRVFDADSAYAFVARQVAFGPRVPNTAAHRACGEYLTGELRRFGAEVEAQAMTLTAYNGERLEARNIIGSYNSASPQRVLLCAHWDTRPYADEEIEPSQQRIPIDGADDGASGVGVLLEIARQMSLSPPSTGVDIIFFDAEDYGIPSFARGSAPDSWCLGSQYWATQPHEAGYRADYGILLDMVGSKNATFYKEHTSVAKAPAIVEKVWATARDLGYGKYFLNATGGYITDDHVYVIAGRNIPCIDIIHYSADSRQGFGAHWHTHKDNMDVIDKATLKAVGQTVLEVIGR